MQNSESNILAKAFLIVGISLALGLIFDYFFYIKIPGISFPLYISLVIIALFLISIFIKKKLQKQILWLILPLMFFSFMVFIRSSVLLTFLNIITSLLILLVIAKIAFKIKLKNFVIKNYLEILLLPFDFLEPLCKTLGNIFKLRGADNNQKILPKIIKGILITIPVLLIFLLLFASADLIFQRYLSNLTNIFTLSEETFSRIVLIIMVTLAFTGAYSYIFGKPENEETLLNNGQTISLGHIENSILLISVNILFFIFIVIQLTYLFGFENTIASQGFTYAEYARKGFFELIAVAVISSLIILITEKYIEKKQAGHTWLYKILSSILIIQVIAIMVSAFKRLLLYEEAYGFTTLRLYSHAFIILLAFIFVSLLYKIFKDTRENTFAFRLFIMVILFLVTMNFLNPDAFIARNNIKLLATTGKLDSDYFNTLSEDAVHETIKLLNQPDENLRNTIAHDLYWRRQSKIDSLQFSKWQSFNLSRLKAENLIKERISEIEPYKDYQNIPSD